METPGATVVISHHVREGKQGDYERWLEEIGAVCRSFPGHMDWQIIRPIPNVTFVYTVLLRFDTIGHLKRWMESDVRARLIEKARPLLAKDDRYHIESGLEFLFPEAPGAPKAPPRWKQWLVTWSAIFPLSIVVPLAVKPALKALHVPGNPVIASFFITGTTVFIMVYLLMPHYTRLIRKWMYR